MALHEFNYEKEKIVNVVKKILEDAILIFATDIHFDPAEDELTIRLRIDGDLVLYTTVPESAMKNIITRIKILAGMNITESSIPQTGFITYKMKDVTHNMRVSSIPVVHGEKIVVHISNHANKFAKLDELNFSEYDLKKIKNLLNNTAGTILIAGSTTSGKATTLYAMVHELDHNKKNIFTIENRIKANMDGINQIQVDKHKGLTPIKILKNVLLSDPNVIVLSEINDIETTNSILKASVTGRLVISTIHSKNIYTTIDTLINMDIENYLLSSSLTGVISQRLVKRLCPKCRKKRKTTDLEKEIFTLTINKNIKEVYEPVGCDNCIGGYQGQLPISEVVEINDTIRNAITNPKEKINLRKLVYENNITIFEDGLNKVINGDTSLDEVIRVIDLNSDFAKDEEILKKLMLDEINANDIGDDNENISVSIRSLIPDKIAIDDIVIEEKEKNKKEDKENRSKKADKEDIDIKSVIDEEEKTDDVDSDSCDINDKDTTTDNEDTEDTENTEYNEDTENNEDNEDFSTTDSEDNNDSYDTNIDDITEDEGLKEINNNDLDNEDELNEDEENNTSDDDSIIDYKKSNLKSIKEDIDSYNVDSEDVDNDEVENIITDNEEDNSNNKSDNLKDRKKENNKRSKKKQNKNFVDDEIDNNEKDISLALNEKEEKTKQENELANNDEENNASLINQERINNISNNYVIDDNGILVAKSIFENQQNQNNDELEEDIIQEDDNNTSLVSQERINNISNNYVIDDNGILVAKSIFENQQNQNNDELEEDIIQEDDNNTSLVSQERINNISNNYVIDDNGILVAKSIFENQQNKKNDELEEDNIEQEENNTLDENYTLVNEQHQDINENLKTQNEEIMVYNDDSLNEGKTNKTDKDVKNSFDKANLSITDEDIKRIKSTFDYDDFSYDDSYKNDF